jgi:ZIP family zinc transporter
MLTSPLASSTAGIALHNFPEGVAVFLSSMKSTALGISIAFAIALHNIPEGVAVALPVYFATGSRWQGFKYAFLSGLAEPAAVVVLGLLFPTDLDKSLVDCLLAAVGGIMAFLALNELLPLAIEHAGRQQAVAALFVGMAIMSANLYLLHEYLAGDEGHGHDHGSCHGHDH